MKKKYDNVAIKNRDADLFDFVYLIFNECEGIGAKIEKCLVFCIILLFPMGYLISSIIFRNEIVSVGALLILGVIGFFYKQLFNFNRTNFYKNRIGIVPDNNSEKSMFEVICREKLISVIDLQFVEDLIESKIQLLKSTSVFTPVILSILLVFITDRISDCMSNIGIIEITNQYDIPIIITVGLFSSYFFILFCTTYKDRRMLRFKSCVAQTRISMILGAEERK